VGSLFGGAWGLLGRGPRKTLILTFAAFSAGAASAFYWNTEVFGFLLAPVNGQLSPFDGKPVFNSPIDMFGATISLSMKVGLVVALPVFTVGLLGHLKPLVPSRLWWPLALFIVVMTGFALAGVSFVYFVLVPVAMGFLLGFGGDVAVPVILLNEYMDLLTSLVLWIGLVFELPIVMYLLAKTEIVPYRRARRIRKWVPWVAIIFAALITPSFEGFLTILVAGPIYLLYEVGLFAAWVANPEMGNYLWLGTIGRWLRKVRGGIVWVLRRPVVMFRWVYRKARGVIAGVVALAREELGMDNE
jgi:sec-independent protein translocase protein TatC